MADTCAATTYSSVLSTLDAAAVKQFYDVGGKYVYFIEGLRLENENEVSGPSRSLTLSIPLAPTPF